LQADGRVKECTLAAGVKEDRYGRFRVSVALVPGISAAKRPYKSSSTPKDR